MRWRHIDEPGAIGNVLDLNALGIHRHPDHLRAMRAEQQARGRVAGVFHGHQTAGTGQYAGNQVQRLLRAVAHHDVLVLTVDATGKRDVPSDRIAQRRQTFGNAVETLRLRHLPHRVGHAAAPVVVGELAFAGGAADKVVAQRTFQRRVTEEHRQIAPALDHLGTGQLGVALLALHLRRSGVDVGAFADHAGEEVFVGQLRMEVSEMVLREMPNCSASKRLGGNCVPAANRPDSIAARNC